MYIARIALIFTVLLCTGRASLGTQPEKKEARAIRTAASIKIDGYIDDLAWQDSEVITGLTQKEPVEGERETETTEIRILYDDRFIYFGFTCFDSEPDKIVAKEMRRDGELRHDDYVEVFLDTYHDHRNAVYFVTNPAGAKRDGLIREEGTNVNWDWDGWWYAKSQRSQEGWTAEMAIPFYTLRYSQAEVQTWGINFSRQIARKKEELFWAPIIRDYGYFGKFRVSFYGNLTGLEDLKQGKRLHVMPYVIGGGEREEGSPMKFSADAGLDLKYRLTSNLTADVSVNTDFAQVESDLEQFNLTRFPLFFPEKRTFFLEGSEIFRIAERVRPFEPQGMILFYSRTIGLSEDGEMIPVMGGLRVTGKTGNYVLGAMDMVTDRITYDVDDEEVHIERANHAVVRMKRDILQKSTVGVMLLSKDSLDSTDYNRGFALDYNFAFGHAVRIEGFVAKTFSPDLTEKDWAANLNFNFNTDFWSVYLMYLDIGEDFNAEMGYVPRPDQRKYRANLGIAPRPNFLNLRQSHIFGDITYIENQSGQLESRSTSLGIFNIFRDRSDLYFGVRNSYEYLDEAFEIKEDVFIPVGIHEFSTFDLWYESNESKSISFRLDSGIGGFYNGNLFRVNTTVRWKVSQHLNLELSYNRNQFDLPVEGGKFTTNIVATRIVYSFSPDLYAKAFVQWNQDEKLFRSNFLIRWIYKPGANVYFIYNETREVGAQAPLQDRVVMIKVTFLFN